MTLVLRNREIVKRGVPAPRWTKLYVPNDGFYYCDEHTPFPANAIVLQTNIIRVERYDDEPARGLTAVDDVYNCVLDPASVKIPKNLQRWLARKKYSARR